MKTIFPAPRASFAALALFAAVCIPPAATAQTQPPAAPEAATALTELTDGEVRKVDSDNRKITLKHGEIRNLDMPPMTMTFNVKDAALLDKLQIGDRVRFRAEKDKGSYWVTVIERSK